MEYSLFDETESKEFTKMKNKVNFSLEENPQPFNHFETINNVTVPVNQTLNLEMTRFKDEKNIYRNPNLKNMSSKSAVDPKPNKNDFLSEKPNKNFIKKPPVFMNTNAVKLSI